ASLATGLAAITVVAAVPPIEKVESEKRQRVLEAMDTRMAAYPRKEKDATRATSLRNILLGIGLLALQVAAATALAWATPIVDPTLELGDLIAVMLFVSVFNAGLYGLAPLGLIYLRWEAIDSRRRGWKGLITVVMVLLFLSGLGCELLLVG